MLTKENLNNLPVQNHFRLRGVNGTRMDGLSDGVFALAIAILLISSSVPSNYQELTQFVFDIIPFSICILFVYWIWNSLSNFNIRYGMEDPRTSFLKMCLLFFVLFYVYPLKFLMSWQVKYFTAIFSGNLSESYQELNSMIPFTKLPELMVIYGAGFILIYTITYFLHRRAYQHREALQLNEREILETQFSMRHYFATGSVGVISVFLAIVSILLEFPLGALFAGVAYNLIWIFVIINVRYEKKKLAEFGMEA
ncbi:MAG: TMEM175 family protein [Saprospiraceae bacterium]